MLHPGNATLKDQAIFFSFSSPAPNAPRVCLRVARAHPLFIPRPATSGHSRFLTIARDELIKYKWINGAEWLDKYQPGGYHPVMIDDLLHGRYRIVDKLGFGGYSTIWLAHDDRAKRYVTLKVEISSPSTPGRESIILRKLSASRSRTHAVYTGLDGSEAVPKILDEFDIQGPNGTHGCYAMAPAQGNLKEASFCRLFPIQIARALAAKLAMAVAFVHSSGFVHGGLFIVHYPQS